MAKRAYRGTVQAEVAALTRRRIMDAALRLFEAEWFDEVTLQRIAAEAGVTVQTILRHFASREGLLFAVAAVVREMTIGERDGVPAGSMERAIAYLNEHYESAGDRMIRLLAQEERYPPLKELLEEGRRIHRAWVGRVFGPLMPASAREEILIPQLVAICDVYVWKLLRRDMGLSAEQYRAALRSMLSAVLTSRGG
jgi:AcrR family transcriptional regulator